MIRHKEAVSIIGSEFEKIKPGIEEIKLDEASLRTLAEDVHADINLPPFDNSAVDGIAVTFNESIKAWKIVGEISAGNYNELDISIDTTVSIMTGSRLPALADTVIPVEDIFISDGIAKLKPEAKFKKGMNIRKLGSDIRKGETVLSRGTFIKSRHLAALASCGRYKIKVYKRLKFAVLATGDELVPVDTEPYSDKIRVSNIYALCGLVNELHQIPVNLGFTGDNRSELKLKLENILISDADIIITTGGVSVGKFDYVKELFLELGVEEKFWRANIKPGKPAFFGIYQKEDKTKLVFGLPGNPVSSQVNFELYIKPFVKKLFGQNKVETVNATLENDLIKKDKKRHFMKAFLSDKSGGPLRVISQISQSSGNLAQFSKANCLIEIEEERLNPRKGETVKCIKI